MNSEADTSFIHSGIYRGPAQAMGGISHMTIVDEEGKSPFSHSRTGGA